MSRPALSALYFVLTFVAGAAVGSWVLWIYLMGFPAAPESAPPAVATAPAAEVSAPPPLPSPPPRIGAHVETLKPDDAAAQPSAAADENPGSTAGLAPAEPTPTPKGHWNTVDAPGRSHAECFALHKALNDAYKDCRFGVHKKEWVPE